MRKTLPFLFRLSLPSAQSISSTRIVASLAYSSATIHIKLIEQQLGSTFLTEKFKGESKTTKLQKTLFSTIFCVGIISNLNWRMKKYWFENDKILFACYLILYNMLCNMLFNMLYNNVI